jgi:hypothetical protein
MDFSPEEEEEWKQTQLYFRAIAERLLSAGWAEQAMDSQGGAGIVLNGKGIDGMDRLFDALKDLDPHTMQAEHLLGLWLHLRSTEEAASNCRLV